MSEIKRCPDCKHSRWRDYEVVCGNPDVLRHDTDYVAGARDSVPCQYARAFEMLCGIRGRRWEPKHKAEDAA